MLIYKPSGRAGEYSEYALNFYKGCSHGCKYCYVPLIVKRNRQEFYKNVGLKKDLFKKLKKELEKKNDFESNVLLSFTSDVYQPCEEKNYYTRKVIEMLNEYDIDFTVLTKNKLASRDFDLYKENDEFAMTLTYIDSEASKRIEPFASLPSERIETLKKAKSKGIKTWASLEPVIWPEQTLKLIEMTHLFVDKYKIGTINYSKQKEKIDWYDFSLRLKLLLEKYGTKYYIKEDLRPYFEGDFVR